MGLPVDNTKIYDKIEVGDVIVFNGPYNVNAPQADKYGSTSKKSNSISATPISSYVTNDDVVITSVVVENILIANHELEVKIYNCNDGIKIIHEDSEELLNKTLERMKLQAMNEMNTYSRKKLWAKVYDLRDRFANVSYGYAITSHKSQGSTYVDTCIVVDDIMINPNKTEAAKILYTSLTRANERVWLLIAGAGPTAESTSCSSEEASDITDSM